MHKFRLGAVKLVPAHNKEERIEIQPIEDLESKQNDQNCLGFLHFFVTSPDFS